MPGILSRHNLGSSHGIRSEIVYHHIWSVPANVLVLRFPEPRSTLCAYQGYRKVTAVCNCYHPKALWDAVDNQTMTYKEYAQWIHKDLMNAILPGQRVAIVSTGVDMRHHVMVEESYDDQWVQAWVTAGVRTNAIRIGCDTAYGIERKGLYEPVGTINIIVLTSSTMGQAALASSFITITEAKTAALQDLNVRSSYNPELQATGTSTDQIAVVSGCGDRCFYVSGQVKLGELMAKAVTRAVKKALEKVRTEEHIGAYKMNEKQISLKTS